MALTIGNKMLGLGHPCYLVFEAGPTHDGLETALALLHQAAQAGADAIKFQMVDADRLVSDRQQLFRYGVLVDRASGRTESREEPLYDILKRRELSVEDWKRVRHEAASLGLAFFSTVSFPEDVGLLRELCADSIKIASSDIDHLPLIRLAAETGMLIQIDTGNATLGEIEVAVDTILATGNDRIVIHQCPSGYPARLPSIQLRMIQTLHQMFPFPIAFSDHTPGWEMDIAAVAMGANMLEKTITLDRCTPSVEHVFSLEGDEMARFVRAIRDLETAMGEPRRSFSPDEVQHRRDYRRSVFLAREVAEGQLISADDLDFRRPGHGLPPAEAAQLVGRTLRQSRPAGHRLAWADLQS